LGGNAARRQHAEDGDRNPDVTPLGASREQRDSAAALTAWNEYLREVPGGRFALEANYNRGICLVRLGRASEARRVLEPFADGLYGGYRQSEATELVKALKGEEADAGAE